MERGLTLDAAFCVMDWPTTLPPCPILRGVIDRVAAAGADHVERMWGVALNTYKTDCDICGAVNEVPNYGDWKCCQCGQGYNYDEAHQITLTDAQLALLRNPPKWISAAERLPNDGCLGRTEDCLLWQEHGDGCGSQAVGYFAGGTFWVYEGDNITASEAGVTITHWMPLPEPPEVK